MVKCGPRTVLELVDPGVSVKILLGSSVSLVFISLLGGTFLSPLVVRFGTASLPSGSLRPVSSLISDVAVATTAATTSTATTITGSVSLSLLIVFPLIDLEGFRLLLLAHIKY